MSALPEGHRIGPYRIVRLLGEGGMGAVYEARQEPLDRRVALKTLHTEYAASKEAVARFFNEAKILSRLAHPSIVQVSDFGNAADGTAYLVMEYLHGESLARRLESSEGRLKVVPALTLAWQIADVLAVAHAQGIVHRDLKPDNLMFVQDPVAAGGERVKILDFGIAKLTRASDRSGAKTDTLAVIGTPMYMSPEQCAGAGGVDAKSDVYSLGCILYQVLAGRPPFIAEGSGQLIGMHLFQTPTPLSSLSPKSPAAVVELVQRLLTKEPAQRPTMSDTADELGRLLSRLSGAVPVVRSRTPVNTDPDVTRPQIALASPSTTLGDASGQRRKSVMQRRVAIAGAGALLLVLASVTVWRTWPATPLSTAQPASPTAAQPPLVATPKSIHWAVDTQPTGATVLDEKDRVMGTTPWTEEHAASTGSSSLRLRREGYAEATVQLDRATDATRVMKLTRVRTPAKAGALKLPTAGSSTPRRNAAAVPPKSPGLPYEE